MFIAIATNIILAAILIYAAVRCERFGKNNGTLHRLMGYMSMGYCRHKTPNDEIVEANKAFVDVFGLGGEPGDIKGRSFSELFVSIENGEETKKQLNMRGFVKNAEQKIRTLGGAEKYIRMNAYIVKDGASGQETVEMLVEDITGEKRAREKGAESRERYEKLFKNSGDMVIICAMEGFTIQEVNSAVEVITGFSAEELEKRQLGALVHPARRKDLDDARKDLMFTGTGRLETVMVGKDGSYKNVIMTLSAVDIGDEKIAMAIIKDVSVIAKDMEESVKRNRELEDFWKASIEREERIKGLKEELETSREHIKQLKEKYGER